MQVQHHTKPELSQEQASNTLERVYNACRLPFDREAYTALAQRARKGRAARLAACILLAGLLAFAVLGALGVFAAGYLHHVIIQPTQVVTSVKPPAATEAWVEGDELVLQLRAGEYAIDYSRITAVLQGDGKLLQISADEQAAQLRLPYAQGDAVYELTLFDASGADYQIVITVAA